MPAVPPQREAGDLGHIADHNDITLILADLLAQLSEVRDLVDGVVDPEDPNSPEEPEEPSGDDPYPVAVAGSGAPSGLPIPKLDGFTLTRSDDFVRASTVPVLPDFANAYSTYNNGPSGAHKQESWWSNSIGHINILNSQLRLMSYRETSVTSQITGDRSGFDPGTTGYIRANAGNDVRVVSGSTATGKGGPFPAECLIVWCVRQDVATGIAGGMFTYGGTGPGDWGQFPNYGENDIEENTLGEGHTTTRLHFLDAVAGDREDPTIGTLTMPMDEWHLGGVRYYFNDDGEPAIDFLTSLDAEEGEALRVWATVHGAKYRKFLNPDKRLVMQTEGNSLTYSNTPKGMYVDWWAMYVPNGAPIGGGTPTTPAGTTYTGADLVNDSHWTETKGSDAQADLDVSGTNLVMTTGASGGGTADESKSMMTAGVPGAITSALGRKITCVLRFGQASGGVYIQTRRDATDVQGLRWRVGYGTTILAHRPKGAGGHTDVNDTGGTWTGTTATDVTVEMIDDPTGATNSGGGRHEIRVWTGGASARPSSPTSAATAVGAPGASSTPATFAALNLTTDTTGGTPAGRIVIRNVQPSGGTPPVAAKLVTIRSVTVEDLA